MSKQKKTGAPNYAEDREFTTNLASENLRDWYYLRSQRAEREYRWQNFYDQWNVGDQDPGNMRNYMGRANLHLPQSRKEVETMSRRIVKALFPEDYLKADPNIINVDRDMAICNAMVVKHYFNNVMHLKRKATPWIKQGVLYGTSPIRSFWRKELNELFFKKRYFDTGPNGELIPVMKKVKEIVPLYDAPEVRTADIFQTWAYPVTATVPDEIEKVFHRRKITKKDLHDMIEEGIAIDIPDEELQQIMDSGKEVDEQFDMTQQRFQAIGESGQLKGHREGEYYDLLEVWGKAEIEGKYINYVQYIINEHKEWCIRLQQNPFFFQRPNFDWMRFILAPGNEFYGRSILEATIPLQYQLDDVLNQGMDSATLALNAITIVNPAYAPNVESFEVEPNAIWWADPNAVKPFTFPDLSDSSMKNAQMLRSIITEMSDNSPQLPDPISGKARSTDQADLAMNEWQTDLYSFVDQVIQEGLLPLAEKTHSLLQQNIEDDAIIRITGKYAGEWINRVITPDDIYGKYSFSWMGAIQIQNESVRTQQMLQFLKILPTIPPQVLQSEMKINWTSLIMKLLRDGFNVKNPEEFVESQSVNNSIDAFIEDKIMLKGGKVEISPYDDDQAHIQSHLQTKAKTKDPYIISLIDYQIRKHVAQIQSKQAAAAQAQQQQQMQDQMQQVQMKNSMNKTMEEQQKMNEPKGAANKTGIMQRPPPKPDGNQGQIANEPMKGIKVNT